MDANLHTLPFKPAKNHWKQVWTLCRAPGRTRFFGLLRTGTRVHPCILGRSGITVFKREADGATPAGTLAVLGGYRRTGADRLSRVQRGLRPIKANLGWCDAPAHPAYNRPVRLPFAASHEKMLRQDALYDVCLVLDWNISRRARNRGSAIFMHLTRPDRGPTQGCIAIAPTLMHKLLPQLLAGVVLKIIA